MSLSCTIYILYYVRTAYMSGKAFYLLNMDLNLEDEDNHSRTDSPHCGSWSQEVCTEVYLGVSIWTCLAQPVRCPGDRVFLPCILCSPTHRTFYSDGYIYSVQQKNTNHLWLLSTWNIAAVIEELFTFI